MLHVADLVEQLVTTGLGVKTPGATSLDIYFIILDDLVQNVSEKVFFLLEVL